MAFKLVLFVCVQAFLAQSVLSQCLGPALGGRGSPFGLAGPAHIPGYGPGCAGGVGSTGGGFPVTSASPIAPTGVCVKSENSIEGALSVGGNLPLLGSVAVDGAFPTAGAGAVSYGCGNGEVGIATESPITTGILTPGAVGPAPTLAGGSLGFGSGSFNGLGYNGFGLGLGRPCGGIY